MDQRAVRGGATEWRRRTDGVDPHAPQTPLQVDLRRQIGHGQHGLATGLLRQRALRVGQQIRRHQHTRL